MALEALACRHGCLGDSSLCMLALLERPYLKVQLEGQEVHHTERRMEANERLAALTAFSGRRLNVQYIHLRRVLETWRTKATAAQVAPPKSQAEQEDKSPDPTLQASSCTLRFES